MNHYIRKKRINFRNHTKERLSERYNVDFTNQDLENMIELIKKGKSKVIKVFSRTRKLHKVRYKKLDILVVYNKYYKEIATVFERENENDNP